MAPQARSSSTRAAVYAQLRRDNEAEAREELSKQLPEDVFRSSFNTCGDFNLSTKVLLATLCFLDPTADIPQPASTDGTSSAQYNQLRRNNEVTIRERLQALVPQNLFTPDVMDRSDFNPTTKTMIAASFHAKEIMREREDAEMSTSSFSDSQNTENTVENSASNLDEIPDSQEEDSFVANLQAQAVRPPMPASGFRSAFAINGEKAQPNIRTRNTERLLTPSLVTTPPRLSLKLRSSSNSNKPTPSPDTDTPNSKQRVPVKGRFDEYNLLANLRTDERIQEMNLDLKPPPLPKKIIQNQGLWELKLKDPRVSPHENEYVQALEQVANRLVAKAKEIVIVMEGDDAACERQLKEAHDLCVDTIAMFEGDINRRKYSNKWMAKRTEWAKKYDLDRRNC